MGINFCFFMDLWIWRHHQNWQNTKKETWSSKWAEILECLTAFLRFNVKLRMLRLHWVQTIKVFPLCCVQDKQGSKSQITVSGYWWRHWYYTGEIGVAEHLKIIYQCCQAGSHLFVSCTYRNRYHIIMAWELTDRSCLYTRVKCLVN